jgi:hypothetical protein
MAVIARAQAAGMTPRCPVCEEPMVKQGGSFGCEPCRQIIIFFEVSDASPYLALAANDRQPKIDLSSFKS